MKTITLTTCMLLFLATGFTSCKTSMVISRGTNFNNCQGYCHQVLTLEEKKITFTKRRNTSPALESQMMVARAGTEYQKVLSTLDVKSFKALPGTIGCPDCADGGSEWIEVRSGWKKRRVTFEFGHAPEVLKNTVRELKALQEGLNKKIN